MDQREESESLYRSHCSSETLRSGSKGFFHEFSESVMNEAGDGWIGKIFARAVSDADRVRLVLTDSRVKDIVSGTLDRVKHLYREKDARIARAKRLEALENSARGNYELALLLASQAVLRAPATGKFPEIDQGLTLPLGLLVRSDALLALRDYEFALDDLKLASQENLPEKSRAQVAEKMKECNRLLEESNKSLKTLGDSAADQFKKQFSTPAPAPLTEGANNRRELTGASSLLEMRSSPKAGEYAVAAKEIVPGDVLASEAPLASALLPQFYGTHCQHCFSRLRAPVGCPVCSSVAFCGTVCRDIALATYHKYECKILALLIGSGMSVLSLLAFRMVTQEGYENCKKICDKLKRKEEKANEKSLPESQEQEGEAKKPDDRETLSKSAKRRLRKKRLEENSSDHSERKDVQLDMRAYDLVTLADKRSPKDFFERTLMALFLLKALQKVQFFDKSANSNDGGREKEVEIGALLLRNLQLLQFNAHEIYETRLAPNHRYRGNKTVYIGIAVYPSVARFNHECYPAVTRYFAGRNIVVRALRPLKIGEVIAENYGPIFSKRGLKDRQRSLMGRYWFKCSCLACVEDWPCLEDLPESTARFKCPTEGCVALLEPRGKQSRYVKCLACQKKTEVAERKRILADCEAEYMRGIALMEEEKSTESIAVFIKAIEKFHRIAVPPHRETHLAEIALAACMADTGNTWRSLGT